MILLEKELAVKIKRKEFNNLYVFYGEETYLIKAFIKKIVSFAVGGKFLEFNYKSCFFEDFDEKDVVDFFGAPAFFSENKVYVLKEVEIAKFSKKDFEFFKKFVENFKNGVVLILTIVGKINEIKKTANFKKFSSSLKEAAFVEFNLKAESFLVDFFLKRLQNSGFVVLKQDLLFLIRRCGRNIENLNNELRKICSFVGQGGEIKREDIIVLTKSQIENNAFVITKNLLAGKKKEVLVVFNELLRAGVDVFLIFSAISICFLDLYCAKVAFLNGIGVNEVCEYFNYKGKEFRIKNAYLVSKSYSIERLKRCIIFISSLDVELKTKSLPKGVLIERLLFFVF